MSPRGKLLSLLEDHQTDGFFVGDNIPERKLENALAHFPVDPTMQVLALIDCTIMGSCKCGMAITERGLIWKNDWTTRSSETSLTWDDFLARKHEIKLEKHDILFGKGSRLNMAGASMKKMDAFHLFIALIHLLEDLEDEIIYGSERSNTNESSDVNPASPKALLPISISSKNQELFEESLITALALMTIADGNIDEEEIDIVIEFIKEEESILDKEKALSEFEAQVGKFSEASRNSKAIFKLQSAKAIQGICKLTDRDMIDRLEIMLEGMVDVAGGIENTQTVDMMKRIMGSFVERLNVG